MKDMTEAWLPHLIVGMADRRLDGKAGDLLEAAVSDLLADREHSADDVVVVGSGSKQQMTYSVLVCVLIEARLALQVAEDQRDDLLLERQDRAAAEAARPIIATTLN